MSVSKDIDWSPLATNYRGVLVVPDDMDLNRYSHLVMRVESSGSTDTVETKMTFDTSNDAYLERKRRFHKERDHQQSVRAIKWLTGIIAFVIFACMAWLTVGFTQWQ